MRTEKQSDFRRDKMPKRKMERPQIDEKTLIEIKTHVDKTHGKIYPDMKSVRALFEYFSFYCYPMDLKCAKCIGHVIEYWKRQTDSI